MINLPKLTDLDVSGKRVLLRLDLDTDKIDLTDYRIRSSIETLDYLKEKEAKIIIIAHKGRPEGKVDESLSLKPFQPIFDKWGAEVKENLRFDPGEENNDPEFAKKLASWGDVYINDAFATSHRESASIIGLPKLLPHAIGFRFAKEVENLSKVFENPIRPLLFIVGGSKKDKPEYIKSLESLSDKILIGGRLPEYYGDMALESVRNKSEQNKLVLANLVQDKEDITLNSIEVFEKEISKAKMIVLAGPMGKYEVEGHGQGTERIFKAVASSNAFKIVGGGDSLVVIAKYKLEDKFDWVSVGGGACLEFLANKTLPGIEVMKSDNVNMKGL
jgi:3-phosphoglycerate kinase